ncbi:hypothetical protein ZWY2020_030252 [Hordeum vulgare]|nr:hypothetical protein ZWY2020_030252 [Hordeum vulgare]
MPWSRGQVLSRGAGNRDNHGLCLRHLGSPGHRGLALRRLNRPRPAASPRRPHCALTRPPPSKSPARLATTGPPPPPRVQANFVPPWLHLAGSPLQCLASSARLPHLPRSCPAGSRCSTPAGRLGLEPPPPPSPCCAAPRPAQPQLAPPALAAPRPASSTMPLLALLRGLQKIDSTTRFICYAAQEILIYPRG